MAIAVFGLTVSASFTDIVLILLPSVSLIIHNIQTISVHFEIADVKDTAERALLDLWRNALSPQSDVPSDELRHIQDEIFRSREVIAQVPDFFYWRQRNNQEQTMRHALEKFKAEAGTITDPKHREK